MGRPASPCRLGTGSGVTAVPAEERLRGHMTGTHRAEASHVCLSLGGVPPGPCGCARDTHGLQAPEKRVTATNVLAKDDTGLQQRLPVGRHRSSPLQPHLPAGFLGVSRPKTALTAGRHVPPVGDGSPD